MALDPLVRILAASVVLAAAPSLMQCATAGDNVPYPGNTSRTSSGNQSGSGASGGSAGDVGDDASSGGNSGSVSGTGGGQPGDDAGSMGDATTMGDAAPGDGAAPTGDGAAPTGDRGGPTGDDGGSCPATAMYPQTQFGSQAVTGTTAFAQGQSDSIPGVSGKSAPAGWDFHQGGLCRDGSPAGFYSHFSSTGSTKLWIYLEGGGACDSATFCSHNPANIAQVFPGGAASQGQTILGALSFDSNGFQQPYVPSSGYSPGIFDFTNAANPFKDWNAIYVPYCTGDVHFGALEGVDIPDQGLTAGPKAQHFVGRKNLELYMGRILATWPHETQVLLTGASAGGFGAGLNLGLVQDSFGPSTSVFVIDDSGPPFSEQYLPACLQKEWRQLWGFDQTLPSDCAECRQNDGSGLTNVVYYWLHKYPKATVGLVSTMQDEVIRLFFAQGNNSCTVNDANLLLGQYSGDEYTKGLDDLVSTFSCTNRIATYYIGGKNPMYMNPTYHQHIFRDEFYKAIDNGGTMTMAKWAADLANGQTDAVGP